MLQARICGIPCLIDVTKHDVTPGSYDFDAASDWEYFGSTDIEYDVYDRKGYRAKWLEAKLTESDDSAIVALILKEWDKNEH